MGKTLTHVRWSSIKSWRRCHKLYHYRWVQNLQRRKPAVPLIRGTMIGQCLDQLVEGKPFAPALLPFKREYGKLFREEKEIYGDLIGEVTRIVTNYQDRYAKDGLTYLPDPKTGLKSEIGVETRLEVNGIQILFTGHLDKLPRDKQKRVFVMDHKSHKTIPDEDARYNDLQLLTYLWLAPQSGLPEPDGVLWDYLRTKPPTVPEVLKDGSLTVRANLDTDYETYLQAIKDNGLNPKDYSKVLNRLKDEGDDRYFKRVFLPSPSKQLIRNMVDDFKSTIVEIHEATNRGQFVRTMNQECSRCEFYQLCSAELRGLDSSFIRKAEYREVPDAD